LSRSRHLLRLLIVALLLGSYAASAEFVRTGNHADFGRVVFDLPLGASASAVQDGARVLVRLDGSEKLLFGPSPRNVRAMGHAIDGAEINLVSGARMRLSRLGNRLVIDALDPPRVVALAPAEARAVAPVRRRMLHSPPPDGLSRAREALSVAEPSPAVQAAPAPAVVPEPTLAPKPVVSPAPEIGSLALIARPVVADPPAPDPISGNRAIALPFASATGAAAFRRGDAGFAVFDERKPIDMAELRDNLDFSEAAITLLPEATQLRIPLPPQKYLVLARTKTGWSVAIGQEDGHGPAPKPLGIAVDQGRLVVNAYQPGRVVSVPDMLTGRVVLVGTQLSAGQGMPVTRTAPEFGLLETWQGVAVVPIADALRLSPVQIGFVLALDPPRPLAISSTMPQTAAEVATQSFSRRFDFPELAPDALLRRLQSAVADAAAAPPQARGAMRVAAGQAMIALGLGVEAQALLTLAATEDATFADDADRIGLSAIAALLAGRIAEADGITDPRLDGSDDVTLWRAIRLAMRDEGAPAAAASFATVFGLVRGYPAQLRAALLPLLAETMALGGEAEAANVLAKTNLSEPGLDFARALLAARDPARVPTALASLDQLAGSSNRLLHFRATTKAIELRLASGAITASQAAEALDRLIYAWRGDDREMATRLRVAELYADTDAWRPALRLLRETAELWPDGSATLQPRLVATFMRALVAEQAKPMPALELLALAEENADLIPPGEAGRALSGRLADRLIALDLPQRAVPLLTRLLGATQDGTARSEIGGKLAAMQLQMGKPDAALSALADTFGIGALPPALLEQRTLIYAQAADDVGQHDKAVAALEALDTAGAVQLQAQLQEAAKNWAGAMGAFQRLTAMTVPADGPLNDDHAQTLLRLASAAAQVGASDTLGQIRARDLPRLPAGKSTDLIRLITSSPVQKVTDLPRAAQEAQNISTAVRSLGP
jgi:hypothetical protein